MSARTALAGLLITALLSACGGRRAPIEERFGAPAQDSTGSHADVVPAAHRGDPPRYPRERDFDDYDEPSPEAQRIAEAALILTGSAFLCTFVVVVLDGACEFGAGFGYHYY
jgi:hypothetical protein